MILLAVAVALFSADLKTLGALVVVAAGALLYPTRTAALADRIGLTFARERALQRAVMVILVLSIIDASEVIRRVSLTGPWQIASITAVILFASSAVVALKGRGRSAMWAIFALIGSHFVMSAVLTQGEIDYTSDVKVFQEMSTSALLDGENPYTVRFPDIYSAEDSKLFYGQGVSVDGYLTRGFPYPPGSLMPVVPAELAGVDVRWAHRVAISLTAVLLLVIGGLGERSRLAAILLLSTPGTLWMSVGGWTEAFLGLFLVSMVALSVKAHERWASFVLGGFFALKQYTVLFVPLLPLLWTEPNSRTSLRRQIVGVVPWIVFSSAFLMWNAEAFVESVITWQFIQPFRADAMSLLVASVNVFGWPPAGVHGILPVVTGFGAAVLAVRRLERSPGSWAQAVAFVLIAFLLFSKQAFPNYYYLALVASAAWMASDDRTP